MPFPSKWTEECLVYGNKIEIPLNKRRFMMGNAFVVYLIKHMEPLLDEIISNEFEINVTVEQMFPAREIVK